MDKNESHVSPDKASVDVEPKRGKRPVHDFFAPWRFPLSAGRHQVRPELPQRNFLREILIFFLTSKKWAVGLRGYG